MKSLKWEGIGTKNLYPHTSTFCIIGYKRDTARAFVAERRAAAGTEVHVAMPLLLLRGARRRCRSVYDPT